ncbi:UNVERIFIED_CONTAM: hypothetical protein Slati_3755400 [Sesamum latifolium]|uniref:Uncharacterized protein n=1 Tax=Sesamum latifolium TaxID=2727402 RepID=A0AAW2U457_9LAMI
MLSTSRLGSETPQQEVLVCPPQVPVAYSPSAEAVCFESDCEAHDVAYHTSNRGGLYVSSV